MESCIKLSDLSTEVIQSECNALVVTQLKCNETHLKISLLSKATNWEAELKYRTATGGYSVLQKNTPLHKIKQTITHYYAP